MKLDKNINPDGQGKYALVNLRKYRELAESKNPSEMVLRRCAAAGAALITLQSFGILSYGGETEAEQFFVIKYKDKFTAAALEAYAEAASLEAARLIENGKIEESRSLSEYAREIEKEAAYALAEGNRIPD